MTSAPTWLATVARAGLGVRGYARAAGIATRIARSGREAWWAFGPRGWSNRVRLARLWNAHRGQRCFVLGGGPSLAAMDLSRLRDEVTIGSNAIFLLFDRMGFAPTYYTVEDTLVAEDRAREIGALAGPTKVLPWALSYCLRHDERTIWVDFRYRYPDPPRFSPDLARAAYWGGTVTFFNLQLAYYLGCRDVYLLGVDHSYRVPTDREGSVIVSREADVNHFHPDYFGPGFRWHDPMVERMERAYLCAREFAAGHDLRIWNATVGGRLEVFPRVDFDTLFDAARPTG